MLFPRWLPTYDICNAQSLICSYKALSDLQPLLVRPVVQMISQEVAELLLKMGAQYIVPTPCPHLGGEFCPARAARLCWQL